MSEPVQLTPYLQTQALARVLAFQAVPGGDLEGIAALCRWQRFRDGDRIAHHADTRRMSGLSARAGCG